MKAIEKFGGFIVLVMSIIALAMLFIEPAMSYTLPVIGTKVEFATGFEAVFGAKIEEIDVETFKFNAVGFIGFLLVIGGAVIAAIPIPGKIKYLISTVLLIVGGVMFFLLPSNINSNYKLATGLILAGVFSMVSAVISLGLFTVSLKK